MTRNLLLLITLALFWGCKETKPPKTLNASSIEVYYDNNWTATGTTNVTNNGIIRLAKCDIKDRYQKIRYYRDTLNLIEIDSINKYLHPIRSENIDTLYNHPCQDCGFLIIRIVYPDTILTTMINGREKFNNDISKLARFILNIAPSTETPVDSSFDFLLKTNLRLVPAPPGL